MPTMRNISTTHQEKYQTEDGNVTVTNFKRGVWQVLPRGKAPFMVRSKAEAFKQAVGISSRHWGMPKSEAFPRGRRSHATKSKNLSAVEDALGYMPEPRVVERAESQYGDYSTNELRREIQSLEDQFEMSGGRGVGLADRLDAARIALALRGGAKRSHATKKAGLSAEQRAEIDAALGAYGARLTDDDRIAKGDKVMSVQIEGKGGRLKMVGAGNVLASYPASRAGHGVSDFVEKFWFWKKGAAPGAAHARRKSPAQLDREIAETLARSSDATGNPFDVQIGDAVQFRWEPQTGGVVRRSLPDKAEGRHWVEVATSKGPRKVPIDALRRVRPEHEARVRRSVEK
ncbi:MAG TPA: hypothetical protein VLE97_11080 [Gaiellaceae bacterium]|nr:hypothetical protein [Gaiellaceae bacterium]